MGDSFTNEFSWSTSRSRVFSRCLRKYYYRHYGSWGGWEEDAPPETRDLYLLKKLHNRHTWRGKLVHEALAYAVKSLLQGDSIDYDVMEEPLLERMRQQFRTSRSGQYHRDPKRKLGLLEHEYDEDRTQQEWKDVSQTVLECVRGFFELDLVDELKTLPLDHCRALEGDLTNPENRWSHLPSDLTSFTHAPLELSRPDRFQVDATPVWVRLDLAYVSDTNRLHLVDWKTGRPEPPDPLQMDVYGCYAWDQWDVDEEAIDLSVVYLPSGERFDRAFTSNRREEALDRIREDVETMKSRLAEPGDNRAEPDDFPRIDDLDLCRRCRYRRVCRPELDTRG